MCVTGKSCCCSFLATGQEIEPRLLTKRQRGEREWESVGGSTNAFHIGTTYGNGTAVRELLDQNRPGLHTIWRGREVRVQRPTFVECIPALASVDQGDAWYAHLLPVRWSGDLGNFPVSCGFVSVTVAAVYEAIPTVMVRLMFLWAGPVRSTW